MKKRNRNSEITEKTLERLRAGDRDAFEVIFMDFYPKFISFNTSLFGSEAIGEEVTNQIFVNLWNNRCDINPGEEIKKQLHNIVRRTVISFLLYSRIGESEKIVEKNARDFDNSSVADDTETLIDIVINRMPYPAGNVVFMSREERLTPSEISLRLNLPVDEIERILKKTAEEVRDVLTKFILIFMTK